MKLLLFSDLHCDAAAAKKLVTTAAKVDVVVGAGDFATGRRGIEKTIDVLSAIKTPTVVVPGNAESLDELADACRQWPAARVLHGEGVTIKGVVFYGIGGGIPVTPFGSWSYDFTEERAAELLVGCPESCVLVSHSPPHGAVDCDSSGRHLGSVALQETVQQRKPQLVVCGHIHAGWGKSESLGSTTVVNAGPRGLVWKLNAALCRPMAD